MRESVVESHFTKRCEARGWLVRKVQWIGRRGAPDRVAFMQGGEIVWVELKAPGKKPEPHQEREHARMRAMGQVVLVLDTIEAVDQFIESAK